MQAAGLPGWIVLSAAIGCDPADQSGEDFSDLAGQGYGVICRLNHGYYPNGSLPLRSHYADFAQRCANFVAASPGCHIWVIGNEPNYAAERPHSLPTLSPDAPPDSTGPAQTPVRRLQQWAASLGTRRGEAANPGVPAASATPEPAGALPGTGAAGDPWLHAAPARFSALYLGERSNPDDASGEPILPDAYADCYRDCRHAIHARPGHEDDLVLVAAVAPWNNQTRYPANPTGDWVQYFADILDALSADGCDGFALHSYTHHADPRLVSSAAKMQPPFAQRHYEFRAYRDFLSAVPPAMRQLPVYITETNQDIPWLDDRTGWIDEVYGEIDAWNRRGDTQKIRAVALYRWQDGDRWGMQNKANITADFAAALQTPRRWWPPAPLTIHAKARLRMQTLVNVRRSPGHINKPADDIVAMLPEGSLATATGLAQQRVDELVWWHVAYGDPVAQGWIAQTDPQGRPLFVVLEDAPPLPFVPGDVVETFDIVNLRRTPGYVGKPEADVAGEIPAHERLRVLSGPQFADGLAWWRVRRLKKNAPVKDGWVAATAPDGTTLLQRVDPGSTSPVEEEPPTFRKGDRAETLTYARLRRTPGYTDKTDEDIVADIAAGTPVVIAGGPEYADDLTWWQVRTADAADKPVAGWMAESAPGGIPVLGKWSDEPLPVFAKGQVISVGPVSIRARRTPGNQDKPDDDVLGEFPPVTSLTILDGPSERDGTPWWKVTGIGLYGELLGWVAQRTPGGVVLVKLPRPLPGTKIPNPATGEYLPLPFAGNFGISQLWGENRAYYSQYTYDGVPLRGHNGIDFLTPPGTPVLAVAPGLVIMVGVEPQGFGLYVLLEHEWGQSIYAHLERADVSLGQSVARGQQIGLSGNSGRSTGPHLHFAIRINPYDRADGWGGYSDPLPYWNPTQIMLPGYMFTTADPAPYAWPPELLVSSHMAPSGMVVETPGMLRP